MPEEGGTFPAPHDHMGSAYILVVEDDLTNQLVAARLLHRLGYQSHVVGNGIEAVKAVGCTRYAAVLMDCQMPGMDGFEATASIRRLEGASGERTPIIGMTANTMAMDRERCLRAGMDDFLAKPVCPQALQTVLGRWITATKKGS